MFNMIFSLSGPYRTLVPNRRSERIVLFLVCSSLHTSVIRTVMNKLTLRCTNQSARPIGVHRGSQKRCRVVQASLYSGQLGWSRSRNLALHRMYMYTPTKRSNAQHLRRVQQRECSRALAVLVPTLYSQCVKPGISTMIALLNSPG